MPLTREAVQRWRAELPKVYGEHRVRAPSSSRSVSDDTNEPAATGPNQPS